MKSVLISIQPKWCELIASGNKTVEVRKTKPKLDVPFKCYIYETKDKKFENIGVCGHKADGTPYIYKHNGGKVIGEFVCDKIDKIFQCNSGWVQEHACISREDYFKYLGLPYNSHFDRKGAYAWHISDLKLYDEPRELWEFKTKCKEYGSDNPNCTECHYYIDGMCYEYDESDCGCNGRKPITRPPQSWCYVESEGSE